MADALKRTAQQQRIQQLQERLELYNAAATRSDTASTAMPTSTAAAAAAASSRAAKPTRAPPPVQSPNTAPAATATTTTTSNGAGRAETVRVSPSPQSHAQGPPTPAPAPRLARNLADDFVGSAASSPAATPAAAPKTNASPFSTAAAAATAGVSSPLRASQVFGYYTGSSGDDEEEEEASESDSEYMEYEVEEVEEYEEDEEDSDFTEDERGSGRGGAPPPTLDNVLRRIFRAYSGSPDRHSPGARSNRGATSPPAFDPLLGQPLSSAAAAAAAATRAASSGGSAATAASTHPLIQRAAELYRQHRQRESQQSHHSPFHVTGNASSSSSSGSGVLAGLRDDDDHDADDETRSESAATSTSSGSYLSPAAAYAALNIGNATTLASRAAAAAAAAASIARSSASPSPPATNATPLTESAFDQLELAYRQLLLLQRGVEYAIERTGIEHFPQPMPHQDKAAALAQQRNALVQRDVELRAAPPVGASLEDLRTNEAAALEASVAAIHAKLASATLLMRPVIDRGAAVEAKLQLLKQRENEVAQQREARIIVEREVVKMEDVLGERRAKLQRRETAYATQLQQHDEQQKAAQQHISEVEQLSKQVSSWLAILEERDRRLAHKEKRLQRVQTDLLRRSEDVVVWKKATQRVKQIPPPPSPPRMR